MKFVSVFNKSFVYQIEEIEKIRKEPAVGASKTNNNFEKDGGLKKGFRGITDLGYAFGVGPIQVDRLGLDIIGAYQFNPYFSLGLGAGVRYYFGLEEAYFPAFVDLRVNFMDNKISPYLSLGTGYAFNIFDGVFFLNQNAGVCFKSSDKLFVQVGVGYEMTLFTFYGNFSKFTSNIGAVGLNMGFSYLF